MERFEPEFHGGLLNNPMAGFYRSIMVCAWLLAVVALNSSVTASWNFSMDADARLTGSARNDTETKLHVLGASLRKTFSDSGGDRLILFALFEARDDLSSRMLHEIYVRYKGPMGKWNITAGRFGLPFGLMTDFSTSRLLYDSLYSLTPGLDVDSGVMVSGVTGDIDYGVALTQGYGAHSTPEYETPDIVSGRAGFTFGDAGDVRFGISGFWGRTRPEDHGQHSDHRIARRIASADITAQSGRWLTRFEFQAGEIDDQSIYGAFGMVDFALLPRWDLTFAGRISEYHQTTGYGYIGAGYRAPWLTMRGGYTYDHNDRDDHIFSFQIYRMLSIPF